MENLKIIKNFIDNYILVYWDRLLDKPNIKNGHIHESLKKLAKKGKYVFGGFSLSGRKMINQRGDYENHLPKGEQQNIKFEKMWCVSENGISNQIETVFNYFISLINKNKADTETKELVKIFRHFGLIQGDKCLIDTAYIAVGGGTTKRGNTFSRPAHFVRKHGLIPKGMFPNYGKWKTWKELYYGKGIWINGNKVPKELLDRGEKVAEYIDITYEWFPINQALKAHQSSCPGTSCFAWAYPDNKGVYQRMRIAINHAIMSFKVPDIVKHIFDSYMPFKKKLALDYEIGSYFVMSFRLKKPLSVFKEKEIEKLSKKGLKYILLVKKINDKYPAGAYSLKDGILEQVTDLTPFINNGVIKLKEKGELQPRSIEDFKKLLNT